jgi:hypothetical protein
MQAQTILQGDSVADLLTRGYEYAYEQGWTDGLPIIPPTPEAVARFVAASGRAGSDLIGVMPPRKGRATVEVIAVNAIMAGCRHEYMPVIVAALEGMMDPSYPLEFMQVTTNPMTPFLLVNGPVRQKLEVNFGTGCLGPGWRANATIGRSMRLCMINPALLVHLRGERGRKSVDAVSRGPRLRAGRQHGHGVQGV